MPWTGYVFAAGLLAYVALAIALCLTRVPWWDEGVFADPAWRFATAGKLGSLSLDENGLVDMPKVHDYTFWQFPGYLVLTGLVFKFTGLSVIAMRAVSLVLGLAYLLGWRNLLRHLSGDLNFANLATAFCAVEFNLETSASNGRMDMMCAAGGLWALALLSGYARLGRPWMLFSSGGCLAISMVSHPLAILYGLLWVSLAIFLFCSGWDVRKALSARRLLLFAAPIVILLGLWCGYVLQDWEAFRRQVVGNSYRVQKTANPFLIFKNDLLTRYVGYYFQGGVRSIKGVLLVACGLAFLLTAIVPRLRASRFLRVLALLAVITAIALAIIDNQYIPPYLLHPMSFFTVLLAAILFAWSQTGSKAGVASLALAGVCVLISAGGNLFRVRENAWRRDFLPVIAAVRPAVEQGAFIIGGSELGFALGFTPQLVDDRYMGLISGRLPDMFVSNRYYGPMTPHRKSIWLEGERIRQTKYELILENPNFSVYRRKQ